MGGWFSAGQNPEYSTKVEGVNFKNPGMSKRKKELDRQKWLKEKAERKAQRQREKPERAGAPEDEDPDIAGIVPGPQPPIEE